MTISGKENKKGKDKRKNLKSILSKIFSITINNSNTIITLVKPSGCVFSTCYWFFFGK